MTRTLLALLSLVCTASCDVREVCTKARLDAQPGVIVEGDGDGEHHLELVAHFTADGRGVAGASIEFGLTWEQASLLVADVETDASGTATFRTSFSSMELDVRMKGAFKNPWIARYDNQTPVRGVAYCEARTTGTLPLSELPQP